MTTTTPPEENHPTRNPTLPSADRVKSAMSAHGDTADEIASTLWLLDHARRSGISMDKMGRLIGRDGGTISKLLAGKYADAATGRSISIANIVDDINHFRELHAQRANLGDEPFVETKVAADLFTLFDLARVTRTIGMVWGPNQSGKSTAAKKYQQQNNHGRTHYVLMPAGGSPKMFMKELLRVCGISDRNSYDQMFDRASKFFDPNMLLVIDEVHEAINGRSLKTITFSLIRQLNEKCGMGIVLIGTDVLPAALQDARLRDVLGQIDNRGVLRRRVPPKPSKGDVHAICKAYGFHGAPDGEARDRVFEIANSNGIGKLCKFFLMARRLANRAGAKLEWTHFLTTCATLKSWAEGRDGAQ